MAVNILSQGRLLDRSVTRLAGITYTILEGVIPDVTTLEIDTPIGSLSTDIIVPLLTELQIETPEVALSLSGSQTVVVLNTDLGSATLYFNGTGYFEI